MNDKEAKRICKKIIKQNNEIVKQTIKNKDINAMHLTANCDKESIAIEIVLNILENQEEVIKILNEGIKRQNKQIDLMAEQLVGLTIFDIDKEEPLILGDKKDVKQYYEKKAEEEK